MAPEHDPKPLEYVRKGPASEFAEYARGEFHRRANLGDDFDAALYDEAVQFILNTIEKQHRGMRSE